MAKKMGRPRFGKEPLDQYFPLRLSVAQREELERLAKADGLSLSDLVRKALDEYVVRHAR